MGTDTPIKDGNVATVRDKNVDSRKASPAAEIGTLRRNPRRIPEGTPNISTPTKDNKLDRFTPGATEPNQPRSNNKQKGKKDAEVNSDAPTAYGSIGKPVAELGETREVDELIEHRVDKDTSTVEFKVKWKESSEATWVPEWSLQEDVPTLVFKYWDRLAGRGAVTGLDHYHAFKILKRASILGKSKNAQYMYQVQWVGYRRTDSTWEHESKLRDIAPREFEKFEAKELASGAAGSQKGKKTRGPGRPRRKAKVRQ